LWLHSPIDNPFQIVAAQPHRQSFSRSMREECPQKEEKRHHQLPVSAVKADP